MPPTKKRALYSSGRITAKKQPRRMEHKACLNPELTGRVLELRRKREELTARQAYDPSVASQLEGVTEDLEEVEAEARAESVHFVAIAIGRKPWEVMKKDHPPTKEQRKELRDEGFNRSPSFNPDTFTPVAFAAALRVATDWDAEGKAIELRELDAEEIDDILNGSNWNESEQLDLLNIVLLANEASAHVDLGNG